MKTYCSTYTRVNDVCNTCHTSLRNSRSRELVACSAGLPLPIVVLPVFPSEKAREQRSHTRDYASDQGTMHTTTSPLYSCTQRKVLRVLALFACCAMRGEHPGGSRRVSRPQVDDYGRAGGIYEYKLSSRIHCCCGPAYGRLIIVGDFKEGTFWAFLRENQVLNQYEILSFLIFTMV